MIRIFIACLLVATPLFSSAYNPDNGQLITGTPFEFECTPPDEFFTDAELYEVFIYPTDFPGQNLKLRCDGTIVWAGYEEIQAINSTGRIFTLYPTYSGEYTYQVYRPDGNTLEEDGSFFIAQAPTPPGVASSSELARLADAGEAFVLSWYFVLGFGLVLAVFMLFPTRTRYDY